MFKVLSTAVQGGYVEARGLISTLPEELWRRDCHRIEVDEGCSPQYLYNDTLYPWFIVDLIKTFIKLLSNLSSNCFWLNAQLYNKLHDPALMNPEIGGENNGIYGFHNDLFYSHPKETYQSKIIPFSKNHYLTLISSLCLWWWDGMVRRMINRNRHYILDPQVTYSAKVFLICRNCVCALF